MSYISTGLRLLTSRISHSCQHISSTQPTVHTDTAAPQTHLRLEERPLPVASPLLHIILIRVRVRHPARNATRARRRTADSIAVLRVAVRTAAGTHVREIWQAELLRGSVGKGVVEGAAGGFGLPLVVACFGVAVAGIALGRVESGTSAGGTGVAIARVAMGCIERSTSAGGASVGSAIACLACLACRACVSR